MSRTLVWFSAGAASAVAAKIIASEAPKDVSYVYCDTGAEHPDNARFMAEVSEWIGAPIETIRSKKYASTWEVFEKRRFLYGPSGALCTSELKAAPRVAYQRPDDIQVFGYCAGEDGRAERFRQNFFEVRIRTPLIERGLSKSDCLAMIQKAGIELPAMYRLGYRNNNCIGCVKGRAGYWNKIRKDFPEVFDRMAKQQRALNAACWHEDGKPVFLDELDPTAGDYRAEEISCSIFCAMTEMDLDDAA